MSESKVRSYSEKDLDRAFERGLRETPGFLPWLLGQTKFAGCDFDIVLIRSDHPWYRSKLTGKDSETDILIVLRNKLTGRVFALHIENKLANGKFEPNQPENYKVRAQDWIGLMKFGAYEDYETILVAPAQFVEKNAHAASHFDRRIHHEAIARFLPEFDDSAAIMIDGLSPSVASRG